MTGFRHLRGETELADIKSPRLLYLKGALFVILGGTAAGLLWLERPTVRTAALLVVAIWAFARAYYFAFYVIEHYIDDTYKFAGLWSFAQYVLGRNRRTGEISNGPSNDK